MKKFLLLVTSFLIVSSSANAQLWKLRKFEVSGGLGMTQFYGDIGGFSRGDNMLGLKDFTYRHTRYNINLNGRFRIMDKVSARINFSFGSLHATDVRGSNEGRNYESATSFIEPAILGEYYYMRNKGDNSFLMMKGKKLPFQTLFSLLDCYVYGGFGGISYNVKPNATLAAKNMRTSGFTPVIPLGLGANFNYSSQLNFGVELGARYVFTDYLEGYSSPYSERKDMYATFNFNVTYKIRSGTKGHPAF